jgi:hypothetical protein
MTSAMPAAICNAHVRPDIISLISPWRVSALVWVRALALNDAKVNWETPQKAGTRRKVREGAGTELDSKAAGHSIAGGSKQQDSRWIRRILLVSAILVLPEIKRVVYEFRG